MDSQLILFMKNWIKNIDFAWIGIDSNKSLGLFYVSAEFVPETVQDCYSLDSYNRLTDFIIDKLPVLCDESSYPYPFKQDLSKGLFVFEYVNGAYEKRGEPDVRTNYSVLQKFDNLFIDLSLYKFEETEAIVLRNL